jgi:hypothetical protein
MPNPKHWNMYEKLDAIYAYVQATTHPKKANVLDIIEYLYDDFDVILIKLTSNDRCGGGSRIRLPKISF